MSKYLDRKEIEEIFKDMLEITMANFCDENMCPTDMAMDIWEDNKHDFNILITQICQLKPKNQITEDKKIVELEAKLGELERDIKMKDLTISGLVDELNGIPANTPYSDTAGEHLQKPAKKQVVIAEGEYVGIVGGIDEESNELCLTIDLKDHKFDSNKLQDKWFGKKVKIILKEE